MGGYTKDRDSPTKEQGHTSTTLFAITRVLIHIRGRHATLGMVCE